MTRGGCLPQNIMKLLADDATAALVKELLKRDGGIARLEDEAWLAVSARLTATGGRGRAGGVRGRAGA